MGISEKRPGGVILFKAAGIACLLFSAGPTLFGVINQGVIALFIAGAALLALPVLWPRLRAPFRRILLTLICTGCAAVLALSLLMAHRAWFSPPPQNRPLPVIVLGGKVNGNRPSLMLARRLKAAADYLDANPGAICIVSGGQGPDEVYPEAYVMAAFLEGLGISRDRIIQEDRSYNTRQNLEYSLGLLCPDGIGETRPEAVIATDAFHQLRAGIFANHLGITSYSLSSETPWGLAPSYWVREWIAIPVAWLTTQN